MSDPASFIDGLDPKVIHTLTAHSPPRSNLLWVHNVLKRNKVKDAIEVGTAKGHSGLFIGSGISGRLFTVDIRPENLTYATKIHRQFGLSNVRYVMGDSLSVLPLLCEKMDEGLHFVYLDGRHTYRYVMKEYYIVRRFINPDKGMILFDDANLVYAKDPEPEGMPKAMREIGAEIHPQYPRLGYIRFGDFVLE